MRIKNILMILGPNLALARPCEKSMYGKETAESIKSQITDLAEHLNLKCEIFQSNWEGALIDKIQEAKNIFDGVIINAGALSHYSYALRDAVSDARIPFVEVHTSNIFNREDFRKVSVISEVCVGQIVGFGKASYLLALHAIREIT